MSQRALVTGITGFVGGFLAEHLLHCGDRVLGAAVAPEWPAPPPPLAEQVEVLTWDFGRDDGCPPDTAEAVRRFAPQVVYHLAAISVPGECGQDAPSSAAWAVNVEGTTRLVDSLLRWELHPRVVFASSSHVYAPPPAGSPWTPETAPIAPRRGYGTTKWEAEQRLSKAFDRGQIDVVLARAFPHTGPRQSPRMMLPEWTRQFVLGTEPVQVHTLEAIIDLSDVRDVVRAYRLLAEHGASGEVYNIGSGTPRRSGAVFNILRRLADPHRSLVETRPGPKIDPVADIARLRAATDWTPEISIAQTVRDTLTWWQANAHRFAG